MQNDDATNKQSDASQDLRSGSPAVITNKKTNRTNKAEKADRKQNKWSLYRHFRQAGWPKRLGWIAAALGTVTGTIVAGTYVADHWQRSQQFKAEQRPRIVIGAFKIADTVTRLYELNQGHPFFVEIPYQNIGRSTAYHVYHHRHVLFGNQYSRLKIEPPDTTRTNERLDPGVPVVTDAVSVQDTYKVESMYVAPDSFRPWDGTNPIVVFGRITYEDSDGTLYCTPFGAAYLNDQTFSVLSDFPPQRISVSDLCPSGSIQ